MYPQKYPPHWLAMVFGYIHGRCHLCGGFLPISYQCLVLPLVCHVCDEQIKPLPPFQLRNGDGEILVFVSAFYQLPFNKMLTRYKDTEDILALMAVYYLLRRLTKPKHCHRDNAVILPVPTTDSRMTERGFYPVLTLAKYLSYLWQIPIWQGVQRHDNIIHQRGLDKAARLDNVEKDFYLTDVIPTKRVIIFDDVITTGATLTALVRTLLQAKADLSIVGVGVLHGNETLHLPYATEYV